MADQTQDLRVRFSAEGMAEVVSAFRTVANEGKKSAKETGDAFAALSGQFSELGRSLVAGLTLVAVVDGLKRLFGTVLDTAAALDRLSKQTGISATTIQAFSRAARETGSSSEAANAALTKFTQQVGRAEIGTKQSANALADLGINVKAFKALSPDEQFLLVAQKLAAIPDPARRARDEVALFGRGSTEVDQALVALGREGIDGFVSKLKELGVFLDENTIQQMKELRLKLEDVKLTVQGMGTQFLVGLAPALEKVAEDLAKATAGGDGFKQFGQAIGATLLFIEGGFEELGLDIATFALKVVSNFNTLGAIVTAAVKRDWQGIKAAWAAGRDELEDIERNRNERFAEIESRGLVPASAVASKAAGPTGSAPPEVDPNADALAKARLAFTKQSLDNELKLFEANSKLELDQAKADYDAGLTSLQDYFQRRALILNAEYDKRIDIAKRKLAAELALPAPSGANADVVSQERATQEEKLRGEIAEQTAAKIAALQQNQNEFTQQSNALKQREEQTEIKLLEIEGKKTEAARKRLDLYIEELQLSLARGGATPDQISSATGQARAQGTAKIGFDEASEQAKADLNKLTLEQKRLQDQVNAGEIFSLTANEKLLEKQREMLPILQADAAAMLAQAKASGDETAIQKAEDFKEKVDQIGVSVNTAGKYMAQMRAGIEQAFAGGLNTFLDDAIFKSKSLGQAFDNAAKQIMTNLAKMALQIEEEKFLKWIFGGMGGGGGGGIGGGGGGGGLLGGLIGLAGGGVVTGPGTSTSDSVPAMLSAGEYVVNARAASQPGVMAMLDSLNSRPTLPRFAVGGSVSIRNVQAAARGGKGAPPVVLRIHPDAMHYTLRDWFEREIADQAAKR